MTLNANVTVPGIGQTWLADFGDDTPFGPFAAEVTFESAARVSFVVTKGSMKGNTDAMDYTTVQVRDGLYVVRWTETKSGAAVTHVEDWREGTVLSSFALGDQSGQMTGTWNLLQ